MSRALTVTALTGIPQVRPGDDLAALLLAGLADAGLTLADGDVLAVSSKVASKALGLTARAAQHDAAVREQSTQVVAERRSFGRVTRVVRAVSGPVLAAAGVDASNSGEPGTLLLLPPDPDAVCRQLHAVLAARTGVARFGVLLTDTAGRPWRAGQTDFALGGHGVAVLEDLRGRADADGRRLDVTARALADEIAAAADLVKGKVLGLPAVLLRGLPELVDEAGAGARSLVRGADTDWFRWGSQEAVRVALGVVPGSPAAEQVGIRPTDGDTVAAQVHRAVRVALVTGLPASVDEEPGMLRVRGEDPVVVGMVAARVLVALAGEEVAVGPVRHTASSVDIVLPA